MPNDPIPTREEFETAVEDLYVDAYDHRYCHEQKAALLAVYDRLTAKPDWQSLENSINAIVAERDCAVEELREVWRSPVFGPQSPNPFCVPDIVEVLLPGSQPGTVKPGMGRYYERQMPYMADKWLDEADEEILPVAWRPLPAATPQEGKD